MPLSQRIDELESQASGPEPVFDLRYRRNRRVSDPERSENPGLEVLVKVIIDRPIQMEPLKFPLNELMQLISDRMGAVRTMRTQVFRHTNTPQKTQRTKK